MATKMCFAVGKDLAFEERIVEFEYIKGMAFSQKQKNVLSFHKSIQEVFPDSRIIEISPLKIRYLPCKTVSGTALMPVFRCDKMKIKGVSAELCQRGLMIGVSDEKIKNGDILRIRCVLSATRLLDKLPNAVR